eukprot:1700510-Prymnesium_polylepis.1
MRGPFRESGVALPFTAGAIRRLGAFVLEHTVLPMQTPPPSKPAFTSSGDTGLCTVQKQKSTCRCAARVAVCWCWVAVPRAVPRRMCSVCVRVCEGNKVNT